MERTIKGRNPFVLSLVVIMLLGSGAGCKSNKSKKTTGELAKTPDKEEPTGSEADSPSQGTTKLPPIFEFFVSKHHKEISTTNIKYSPRLTALMEQNDPQQRLALIDAISKEPAKGKIQLFSSYIEAVGLSPDFWTMNMKPAAIVVHNPDERGVTYGLKLECHIPSHLPPVSAFLEANGVKRQIGFKGKDRIKILLPMVPAKSKRLFLLTTDKSWSPGGKDRRNLGVRVTLSLCKTITALAQSDDKERWDEFAGRMVRDKIPDRVLFKGAKMKLHALDLQNGKWIGTNCHTALVLVNGDSRERHQDLILRTTKAPNALNILTAGDKQTINFRTGEPQRVALPAMAPRSKRLIILSTELNNKVGFGVSLAVPPSI